MKYLKTSPAVGAGFSNPGKRKLYEQKDQSDEK
jgi:hypothetical protein